MNIRHLTSPCGRDCFNCPVYLAKDRPKLRSIIARKQKMPESQVQCRGCRVEEGRIPYLKMTDSCPVYACSKDHAVQFCFECENFPCDRLHPVADMADRFPHNTKVFNLCLIQRMGLEAWAESKAKQVFQTYMKEKLMEVMRGQKER